MHHFQARSRVCSVCGAISVKKEKKEENPIEKKGKRGHARLDRGRYTQGMGTAGSPFKYSPAHAGFTRANAIAEVSRG